MAKKPAMLQSIRHYFDISNASLAHYLGISIDMMHSISANRRDWSFEALMATTKLDQALNLETAPEALEIDGNFQALESYELEMGLPTIIQKVERALRLKQRQLDQLEENRWTLLRGHRACGQLLAAELTAHQRKWLETKRRHLEGKLKQSSQLKVCSLQAEVSGLEVWLERLRDF